MSPLLLEASSLFLLVTPGFLPLLFFVHHRLVVPSSSASRHVPGICVFVFLLGPLAAIAASLGLAALVLQDQVRPLRIAQSALQILVELAYRTAILYLVMPRSFAVLSSRITISSKDIRRHNTLAFTITFATFLISILQTFLPPSAVPTTVPPVLGILAALFPVPLIVHLALSTTHSLRVHRMWAFAAILQILSALAAVSRVPQGAGYALFSAVFTVLWGGGILTLFYAIFSAPLPPPLQPLRVAKFSALSTPTRVQNGSPHVQPPPGVMISEDFTTLRDPFASPPPVSPVSSNTPIPRAPSPLTPTPTPRIALSPPPTPTPKIHRPPRPKARETKPQRRSIAKQSSLSSKRTSSHSLMQPLSPDQYQCWRNGSGSEDALILTDEALLSQILLHSLTMEAAATLPPKEDGSSTCSGSIGTIRTRRDENGRRYASEQVRHSDPEPVEEDEESQEQLVPPVAPGLSGARHDHTRTDRGSVKRPADRVVVAKQQVSTDADVARQSVKEASPRACGARR